MKIDNSTRRQFLSAATVAGAPMVVPAHVLGRGGSVAPSDRVTVGFIGIGRRAFTWPNAKVMVSAVGMPACRVLAVCDVDRNKRDAGKEFVDKAYGNKDCTAYRDFREMLARKDIQAVFVTTPHHWHAIMAIMGLEAGKDVYVEKPISKTVRESVALGAAARRYPNQIIQAGTQARTSRLQNWAVKQIQGGAIGDVKQVITGFWGPPRRVEVTAEPVPEWLDWDLYVGPAPMCPYSSKMTSARWELSGGSMTDWGQHMMDVAQWGLGMDKTGPVEVFPPDEKDHEFLTLRYANGAEVKIHAKDGKRLSEGTTFIGSKGKIFLHPWNDDAGFEPFEIGAPYYKELGQKQPEPLWGETYREPEHPWNNALSDLHLANFLECVRTRKKPNAQMEFSHRSIILCHLANIVLWAARPLKWNPDKYEFVNDREANGYLHIPPREPWKV
jgi:predicted dehydrogenase